MPTKINEIKVCESHIIHRSLFSVFVSVIKEALIDIYTCNGIMLGWNCFLRPRLNIMCLSVSNASSSSIYR